jgi:hypothetical protein
MLFIEFECGFSIRLPKKITTPFHGVACSKKEMAKTYNSGYSPVVVILGITSFPTKPMSILEWMTARESEVIPFIPVDYSTDFGTILCTVTWAVLISGGLQFLLHIMLQRKSFASMSLGSLLSRVIDCEPQVERLSVESKC